MNCCNMLSEYMVLASIEMHSSSAKRKAADRDAYILPQTHPVSSLTYVQDRLYLASYTTPPNQGTLFPYPAAPQPNRSPNKRSARAADGPVAVSDKERIPPYYFTIDDTLLYNAFHHDFGPLHIGHLYRFAVQFHDILGDPENKGRPVVFWSKADARSMFTDAILSGKRYTN
jgi:cell division cycle 14